jgi:hypothetical protein
LSNRALLEASNKLVEAEIAPVAVDSKELRKVGSRTVLAVAVVDCCKDLADRLGVDTPAVGVDKVLVAARPVGTADCYKVLADKFGVDRVAVVKDWHCQEKVPQVDGCTTGLGYST